MSDDADETARAASASEAPPEEDRDVAEELVSRLQLIEEQPLGDRAAAFALLHDELRARLEGGDGAAARG
ncbi:hypothetical protein [Clavibacter sp. VKM Ac-2872]|uniref:hypothetical protein n=1 Tax=Clavibacter sp. VKM Ac-2872 TaxID=2783812 RepID=UPI00188D3CBC|nr:hypothetical protein [Clavibacter sp. VKM Ac-2872]MBF4624610.1 hypothetical protein [Clavibacter sp. VKM Ac-2872]